MDSTLEALIAGIEADLGHIDRARDDAERRELLAKLRSDLALVRERLRESGVIESLSTFLQSSGELEKASLARELHDHLGGILTPAKMDVAWLRSHLGDDPQFGERMARLDALIDQGDRHQAPHHRDAAPVAARSPRPRGGHAMVRGGGVRRIRHRAAPRHRPRPGAPRPGARDRAASVWCRKP